MLSVFDTSIQFRVQGLGFRALWFSLVQGLGFRVLDLGRQFKESRAHQSIRCSQYQFRVLFLFHAKSKNPTQNIVELCWDFILQQLPVRYHYQGFWKFHDSSVPIPKSRHQNAACVPPRPFEFRVIRQGHNANLRARTIFQKPQILQLAACRKEFSQFKFRCSFESFKV